MGNDNTIDRLNLYHDSRIDVLVSTQEEDELSVLIDGEHLAYLPRGTPRQVAEDNREDAGNVIRGHIPGTFPLDSYLEERGLTIDALSCAVTKAYYIHEKRIEERARDLGR